MAKIAALGEIRLEGYDSYDATRNNVWQAMVAEFRRGNFTGVEGIILRIVLIQNPLSIDGRTQGSLLRTK